MIKSKVSYTSSFHLLFSLSLLETRPHQQDCESPLWREKYALLLGRKEDGKEPFLCLLFHIIFSSRASIEMPKWHILGEAYTDHLQKLETAALATIILGQLSQDLLFGYILENEAGYSFQSTLNVPKDVSQRKYYKGQTLELERSGIISLSKHPKTNTQTVNSNA